MCFYVLRVYVLTRQILIDFDMNCMTDYNFIAAGESIDVCFWPTDRGARRQWCGGTYHHHPTVSHSRHWGAPTLAEANGRVSSIQQRMQRAFHVLWLCIDCLQCGEATVNMLCVCLCSCVRILRSGIEDIARATVFSLPSVSVPEKAEAMPDVVLETLPPHTTPNPSFGTEVGASLKGQHKYIA